MTEQVNKQNTTLDLVKEEIDKQALPRLVDVYRFTSNRVAEIKKDYDRAVEVANVVVEILEDTTLSADEKLKKLESHPFNSIACAGYYGGTATEAVNYGYTNGAAHLR